MAVNGSAIRHRFLENEKTPQDSTGTRKEAEKTLREAYREQLEDFREDVLRDVKKQLDPDRIIERLLSNAEKHTNSWPSEKRAESKPKTAGIDGKVFTARESELTELFKISHISTIYNVFVATLLMLFLSTGIHDVINTGSVNLGFELLSWNFHRFPSFLFIWLQMKGCVVGLYYGYCFWAKTRASLQSSKRQGKLDKTGVVALIAFFLFFLGVPAFQVRWQNLPFACAFAVLMEQARLLMKSYAFVRTNVPRTLAFTATDKESYFVPSFDKYLYFLFAPTLIYRDEYPRTIRIRWSYVFARFSEIIGISMYVGFITERYLLPSFRDFGKPGIPFLHILGVLIDSFLPAIVCMVCMFYALFHVWLNGMAEIMRFADRKFYTDWWNSKSYAEFYKTWNIVVYDWLYTFIYNDAGEILCTSRTAKALLVITVSALFHEFMMAITLGFFVPAFILLYGLAGSAFMQLTWTNPTFGNIYIWFTLSVGTGIMSTLYFAEFYARINCPQSFESPIVDFLVPRMITCLYSRL